MTVDVAAIAVVIFNVGLFVVLLRVLRIALKLPHWLIVTRRFFAERLMATQSLPKVPRQFDRLNQSIFNSNRKLAQLTHRLSVGAQLSQLSGWVSRRRIRSRRR